MILNLEYCSRKLYYDWINVESGKYKSKMQTIFFVPRVALLNIRH